MKPTFAACRTIKGGCLEGWGLYSDQNMANFHLFCTNIGPGDLKARQLKNQMIYSDEKAIQIYKHQQQNQWLCTIM